MFRLISVSDAGPVFNDKCTSRLKSFLSIISTNILDGLC